MKHRLASKGIKTKTSSINFNSQGLKEEYKVQETKEDILVLEYMYKEMAIETYNNLIDGKDEQVIPTKYFKGYENFLNNNALILGIVKISNSKLRNNLYIKHNNGNVLKINTSMFMDDGEVIIDSLSRKKRNIFNREKAIEELELRKMLDIVKL